MEEVLTDLPLQTVSTDGVPAPFRVEHFREQMAQSYLELDFRTLAPGPFHGRARSYPIGQLLSGRIACSPVDLHRPKRLVGTSHLDGCYVCFQVGGHGVVEQAGRFSELAPGDVFLVEAHRVPFRFSFAHGLEHLVLHVPAELLPPRLRRPGAVGGSKIPGDSAPARLLLAAVRAATEPAVPPEPDEAAFIGEHLLGMLHALWFERGGTTGRHRVEHLLPWLDRHLHDPALTLEATAAELGCSRRTIQLFFQRRGETFSQYVQRRRVRRAEELLRSIDAREAKILEIALEVGFSDVSTFCRTFRRVTGVTASAYRSGCRADDRA